MNWLKRQWTNWFGGHPSIAKFEFEDKQTPSLGVTRRPMAVIEIWSDEYQEWQRVQTVVDTGADLTILPRYWSALLGVDPKKDCQQIETEGLGGGQNLYLKTDCKIRIGGHILEVPIGFVGTNHIPPLLGRHQILSNFQLLFEYDKSLEFKL